MYGVGDRQAEWVRMLSGGKPNALFLTFMIGRKER